MYHFFITWNAKQKRKSSTFHSCPWDPATLWHGLPLYFEGIAPRGPPLPTACIRRENDNSWNRTPRSQTISLLRGSPRSAQMPEAGSWKRTIDPAAKKNVLREKITRRCKNLEIKCHLKCHLKMSNFVTLWVFSHSIWVRDDSDSHGFPGASYDIAYSPNLAALGIQNSREVLPILDAKPPGKPIEKLSLRSTYPQCE